MSQAKESQSFTKLQSAYLFKIANFVSWPHNNELSNTTFTICVVGDLSSALYREMKIGAETLRIHEKAVSIVNVVDVPNDISNLVKCNLIYLYREVDAGKLIKWMSRDHKKNILWIASPYFSSHDVYIDLAKEQGRLSIYINKDSLASSSLSVAGPLLSVSRAR